MRKITIIPARSGSKRIKNKNIKNFLGKPIISYVIKQAIKSKLFDYVIVSTDSTKIKKISEKYGAKVFFKRPTNLSNDKAITQDVIIHSLNWFKKKNVKFKYVCCIYPTSVFIKTQDLKNSLKLIKNKNWSFVISAQKYSTQIERAFRLSNNKIVLVDKKKFLKNSQDLKDFYHDAGQFYWGKSAAFKQQKIIFSEDSTPYVLESYLVQDIDTLEDWKRAELMYQVLKEAKEID